MGGTPPIPPRGDRMRRGLLRALPKRVAGSFGRLRQRQLCSTSPAANFSTKNHHKTIKIKDSEAEILRTPIKIEKLSLWNRTWNKFIMNFEFHRFLEGLYFMCF